MSDGKSRRTLQDQTWVQSKQTWPTRKKYWEKFVNYFWQKKTKHKAVSDFHWNFWCIMTGFLSSVFWFPLPFGFLIDYTSPSTGYKLICPTGNTTYNYQLKTVQPVEYPQFEDGAVMTPYWANKITLTHHTQQAYLITLSLEPSQFWGILKIVRRVKIGLKNLHKYLAGWTRHYCLIEKQIPMVIFLRFF